MRPTILRQPSPKLVPQWVFVLVPCTLLQKSIGLWGGRGFPEEALSVGRSAPALQRSGLRRERTEGACAAGSVAERIRGEDHRGVRSVRVARLDAVDGGKYPEQAKSS